MAGKRTDPKTAARKRSRLRSAAGQPGKGDGHRPIAGPAAGRPGTAGGKPVPFWRNRTVAGAFPGLAPDQHVLDAGRYLNHPQQDHFVADLLQLAAAAPAHVASAYRVLADAYMNSDPRMRIKMQQQLLRLGMHHATDVIAQKLIVTPLPALQAILLDGHAAGQKPDKAPPAKFKKRRTAPEGGRL